MHNGFLLLSTKQKKQLFCFIFRSNRQKILLRSESGVTEREGQFDDLKTYNPIQYVHSIDIGNLDC